MLTSMRAAAWRLSTRAAAPERGLAAIASDPWMRNQFPLSSAATRPTQAMMLRGDGIGREVTTALERVFDAASVPVQFRQLSKDLSIDGGLTPEVSSLFNQTRVAIKGPFWTPLKNKNVSVNIQLRTKFDLFANVVHAYDFPGVDTRHTDIDIVIIRENTEGEYSGLEHQAVDGVVESLKIISRAKCLRIAEYAFEYAVANNREKVTTVHKANIMKLADGLFLKTCSEVAERYPSIKHESMIVDNTCMQMVSRPDQFDVMILPNLYGNIVTNIATGLCGGPGLFPGANIGVHGAIFEQGARHSARQLEGKNIANPTATILAGVMMLRYLKLDSHADAIENAVTEVYKARKIRTADVLLKKTDKGATTLEFTQAVVDALKS
jgi:isocitrate dehydrogenase (NAD+)